MGGVAMTATSSGPTAVDLHPDDVLLALLTLGSGPRGGQKLFPTSSPRLHTAFNHLLERPEAQGILGRFAPTPGAPYPYSPQLARSLAHLERSRLIGKHNPDFEQFFVADDAPDVFARRVRPHVPADVAERLQALSVAFWRGWNQPDD
jgi:hypothetical protein